MGMLEPHRTKMNGYIFYMEIPVNWIVSGGVSCSSFEGSSTDLLRDWKAVGPSSGEVPGGKS